LPSNGTAMDMGSFSGLQKTGYNKAGLRITERKSSCVENIVTVKNFDV
jgi:hypothetical protein